MGRDRDSHYFLSLKSFPPFLLLCHAIAVALSFLTLLTSKASPHFSFFVLYFFKILGHNPGLYISCCKPLNWSTYHAHSHGKRRQLLLLAFSFFFFFFCGLHARDHQTHLGQCASSSVYSVICAYQVDVLFFFFLVVVVVWAVI